MKAMIFAAGLGTRLGTITRTTTKALLDINGKTVLHRAVEKCSTSGFDDIIINVHHFAEEVEKEIEYLRKSGYNISVSDERDGLLENGGGLFKAKWFFDDNPFLLYNADIISDYDIPALFRFHRQKGCLATLATRHRPGKRFILVDSEGRLRGWRNVETGEEKLRGVATSDGLEEIAFSSMHIVEPEIFNYMRPGKYSMIDLYLELAAEHTVYTLKDDGGYWVDVGTPESLDRVRKILSDLSPDT
jgi:NDP-sugar pyrophosphorylase family protein